MTVTLPASAVAAVGGVGEAAAGVGFEVDGAPPLPAVPPSASSPCLLSAGFGAALGLVVSACCVSSDVVAAAGDEREAARTRANSD